MIYLFRAVWSPDGRSLLSANSDGTLTPLGRRAVQEQISKQHLNALWIFHCNLYTVIEDLEATAKLDVEHRH